MLIKKECFDNLNPGYQNVINDLEEKLAAIPEDNIKAKLDVLKDFWLSYITLKEYLDEYLRLMYKYMRQYYDQNELYAACDYARLKRNYHFVTTENYRDLYWKNAWHEPPGKIMTKICDYNEVMARLSIPQGNMEKRLKFYREKTPERLPKQVLEKFYKAKKLYQQIINAKDNQEEWFKLIIQIENDECIYANIEDRIGRDMENKELWKLYIELLKKKNVRKILDVYSRYCRYFLDDEEMKTEYQEAVKQFGPSIVFWKNPFDFETFQEDPDLIPNYFVAPEMPNNAHPNLPKFSDETVKSQIFALPKTIMWYIKENAEPDIIHRLHKCCKYFFTVSPYPICHNFNFGYCMNDGVFYDKQSVSISVESDKEKTNRVSYDRKYVVSNCFHYCRLSSRLNSFWGEGFLTETLSSIEKCTAKFIRVAHQHISFKELKFLIGHGNVEVFDAHNCNIFYEDRNNQVDLEEILQLLPKCVEFNMKPSKTTPKTFEILPTIKFQQQFECFKLYHISYFETDGFVEFIKKNIKPSTEFEWELTDDIDGRFEIHKLVKNEMKQYWQK